MRKSLFILVGCLYVVRVCAGSFKIFNCVLRMSSLGFVVVVLGLCW